MATIVEPPMSGMQIQPVVPHRRRRESFEWPEVIDVDELDEQDIITARRPPPAQRRRHSPETIELLDSDDEAGQPVASGSGIRHAHSHIQAQGHRAHYNHRRLFSPPPRGVAGPAYPPPVPPVPRRYAGQTSLPMRQRPPPFPGSPPILPIDRPFPFELQQQAPPPQQNQNHNPHPHPHLHNPQAQPHPPPRMHLGGALIAHNRPLTRDRIERRVNFLTRAHGAGRNLLALGRDLFLPGNHYNAESAEVSDDEMSMEADELALLEAAMHGEILGLRHENRMGGSPLRRMRLHRLREREQQTAYKPAFTHPVPVHPGFTYDFAPPEPGAGSGGLAQPAFPKTSKEEPIVLDDSDSEEGVKATASTSASAAATAAAGVAEPKLTARLVCARCMDPLVLSSGLSPADAKERRVWGLRCGHLIDGKCMREIGEPHEEAMDVVVDVKGKSKAVDVKGKGKVPARKTKGKGKGKARMIREEDDGDYYPDSGEEDEEGHAFSFSLPLGTPAPDDEDEQDEPDPEPEPEPEPEASSMRSRLRSHPFHAAPAPPAPTRKPRARPKPKTKPRIERTHTYLCPVPSCARLHASVLVEGTWMPEQDAQPLPGTGGRVMPPGETRGRGAVVVFV